MNKWPILYLVFLALFAVFATLSGVDPKGWQGWALVASHVCLSANGYCLYGWLEDIYGPS